MSTSGLARNGQQWPIFAWNAHTPLRSHQLTGRECYGTSADDRNTTSCSMRREYLTLKVAGSTFLPSRGFWIVDLRVQTAVFAVSIKLELAVSRSEVVLRDRSGFLRPRYGDSDDAGCEGAFSLDSISITFVHWRTRTPIETRHFGRPFQVIVRPMLWDLCPVWPVSVCNVGILWRRLLGPLCFQPTLLWHGCPSQQLLTSCLWKQQVYSFEN